MLPVELKMMAATPTAVYPNRCLQQRNENAGCKKCLDACRISAVKLDQRAPSLDANNCFGCGLCLVACPVECFETEDWSERSLVSALEHIGRPAVEIACKSHPDPSVGKDAYPVVQVNTCVGAISPGLWFEVGLKYTVKVRLEYCSACGMGRGAAYTRRAVELANGWLLSCGRAPVPEGSILIQEARDEPAESLRRIVISAERPILNRRDFLFGFARSSGPAELALQNLPPEARDGEERQKVPPHLPAWLRRLAAIYPKSVKMQPGQQEQLEADEVDSANWPTLNVAENCAASGACSLSCPSGALTTKVVDGSYQHLFTPGLCVACGLCALVCTTGALSRSYAADKSPFERRVMAERPVITCRKCGNPALKNSDGLCYCCASEPSMNSLLDNARGHLLKS